MPPQSRRQLLQASARCLGALALGGCGWTAKSPPFPAVSTGKVGDPWWRDVGGEVLDRYVRESLANSPSVEILAARVELARANARFLTTATQPSIGLSGARPFGERQVFETGGEQAEVMRYTGGARFSWEIDFWGRVQQRRLGATRQIEAAVADEAAGRLVLIAEIARLDLARRRLAAEAGVVQETASANDESVRLLEEKLRVGIIDDSTLNRQLAEGETLRREITELKRQRRLAELSLDRLLGRKPGTNDWPPPPKLADPPPVPEVLRSEVLARRPDIRASAARVAAAWHLSQAAALDLLPKLEIRGLASAMTMRLTPSIDQWIAQVAPTLDVPLWDPLRLARLDQSRAQAKLVAAEYRADVLRAFEEVAAALTNLSAQANIEVRATTTSEKLRSIFQKTMEKFRNGLVSQLEVLEDQRRYLEAQRAALHAREEHLSAHVDLKKAMGG